MKLTIYSKNNCHLCEEAKSILAKYPVEIEEIDIETDPQLFEKYQYEIPVIFLDDHKIFKYRVDEGKLRALLRSGRAF